MSISSFIKSVRANVSSKYQSEKARVSQAKETNEKNKLPVAVRNVVSTPSISTPSVNRTGRSNRTSSSSSSGSSSNNSNMVDREFTHPRGVETVRPINNPEDVQHRTNQYTLEQQQLEKDSKSLGVNVTAYNLRYGNRDLSPEEYNQAQSELVVLQSKQQNVK